MHIRNCRILSQVSKLAKTWLTCTCFYYYSLLHYLISVPALIPSTQANRHNRGFLPKYLTSIDAFAIQTGESLTYLQILSVVVASILKKTIENVFKWFLLMLTVVVEIASVWAFNISLLSAPILYLQHCPYHFLFIKRYLICVRNIV